MNLPADSKESQNPGALRVYLRGAAVLLPSLVTWFFSDLFLLPKLEVVWKNAGLESSHAQWLLNLSVFFHCNFRVIFGLFVLLITWIEIKSSTWPRYRAVVIDVFIVSFYTAVLVGVTTVATSALLAVPLLSKTR